MLWQPGSSDTENYVLRTIPSVLFLWEFSGSENNLPIQIGPDLQGLDLSLPFFKGIPAEILS